MLYLVPFNVIAGALNAKIAPDGDFWINGKRDLNKGNEFYYDSGEPVVSAKYVTTDNSMAQENQACLTLKAFEGNTYQADSANCATKKSGVFCMKDNSVTTTTTTTTITTTITTEKTTTTTEGITTESPKPNYPGANLPKMPRLCLSQREKREAKSKYLIQCLLK